MLFLKIIYGKKKLALNFSIYVLKLKKKCEINFKEIIFYMLEDEILRIIFLNIQNIALNGWCTIKDDEA